jgi:hypothetical protein
MRPRYVTFGSPSLIRLARGRRDFFLAFRCGMLVKDSPTLRLVEAYRPRHQPLLYAVSFAGSDGKRETSAEQAQYDERMMR